jgi:hypothetical protein
MSKHPSLDIVKSYGTELSGKQIVLCLHYSLRTSHLHRDASIILPVLLICRLQLSLQHTKQFAFQIVQYHNFLQCLMMDVFSFLLLQEVCDPAGSSRLVFHFFYYTIRATDIPRSHLPTTPLSLKHKTRRASWVANFLKEQK